MFYRRKMPWWHGIWMRISPEYQKAIVGYYWSTGINVALLVVAAFLCIATPKKQEPITLTISSITSIVDEPSVEIEPAVDVPDEPEGDEPEPEEPQEPEPDQSPIVEPQSEPVEAPIAVQEAAESSASQESDPTTPQELSSLTSNEARIQETNRRVAEAGGGLKGPLRVSLSFAGASDIDLHVAYDGFDKESRRKRSRRSNNRFPNPFGFDSYNPHANGKVFARISYQTPRSNYAQLDVDANARSIVDYPCENILFHDVPRLANYTVFLDHFRHRGQGESTPYVVVVKYGRTTKVFEGEIAPHERMKRIYEFKYKRS